MDLFQPIAKCVFHHRILTNEPVPGERPGDYLWLLGQLHNCRDRMPDDLAEALGLPAGSDFRDGARKARTLL